MTNADVIDLAKSGVSEWNIISMVLVNKSTFSTAPSDIAALRSAGVTEPVIKAMMLQVSTAPSVAGESVPPGPNPAKTTTANRSTTPAPPVEPKPMSAVEEGRRIQEFEEEQQPRTTKDSASAPSSALSAERERQMIERFEAEQRGRDANSTEKPLPGNTLTEDEELRLIRQYEAEQGAAVTPEAGGVSDGLTEEEELRLIEEYEATQKQSRPQ
jgi:hypothetical protein